MKCSLCNEPIVTEDFIIVVLDEEEKCYHNKCDSMVLKAKTSAAKTKQYGFTPIKKSKSFKDSEIGQFE